MYELWDPEADHMISSGHLTIDDAETAIDQLRADIRRQITATGDGCSEFNLTVEVREADTGKAVLWDHGTV